MTRPKKARNHDIVQRAQDGETHSSIAVDYDISHQRVSQIVNRAEERCRQETRKAIEEGRLSRPDMCNRCGEAGDIEAHHSDYTKPMDVEWLCASCHGAEHRIADHGGRMKRRNIMVEPWRWQDLEKEADRLGVSVSAVIRMAVDEYLG